MFHPVIVELIEGNRRNEITDNLVNGLLKEGKSICLRGVSALDIEWVPEGAAFRIDFDEETEIVILYDDGDWFIA